jgi:hypothetical protein
MPGSTPPSRLMIPRVPLDETEGTVVLRTMTRSWSVICILERMLPSAFFFFFFFFCLRSGFLKLTYRSQVVWSNIRFGPIGATVKI